MKNKRKLLYVFTLLLPLLLTCSDVNQNIKLKVFYTKDAFNGYYVVDGGNAVLISGGTTGGTTGLYEVDLSVYTSLRVQVAAAVNDSTLTVLIYKDSQLVKDGTSSGTGGVGGVAASVTLTYSFETTSSSSSSSQ